MEIIARKQASRSTQDLISTLSKPMQKAYYRNPQDGARWIGIAVHEETAKALGAKYKKQRLIYHCRGPDFEDTKKGVLVELTTPGRVAAHQKKAVRDPRYGIADYATY